MKNKCARLLTAAVVLLMVVMVLSLSGCGKKNDVEMEPWMEQSRRIRRQTQTGQKIRQIRRTMQTKPHLRTRTAATREAPSFAALQYVDFTFSSGAEPGPPS